MLMNVGEMKTMKSFQMLITMDKITQDSPAWSFQSTAIFPSQQHLDQLWASSGSHLLCLHLVPNAHSHQRNPNLKTPIDQCPPPPQSIPLPCRGITKSMTSCQNTFRKIHIMFQKQQAFIISYLATPIVRFLSYFPPSSLQRNMRSFPALARKPIEQRKLWLHWLCQRLWGYVWETPPMTTKKVTSGNCRACWTLNTTTHHPQADNMAADVSTVPERIPMGRYFSCSLVGREGVPTCSELLCNT